MNTTAVPSSFLRSDQAFRALDELRKGIELNEIDTSGLTSEDKTYLEAEACVRSAMYSQLDAKVQAGTNPWVKNLAFCYRDLFVNPQRALNALDDLEKDAPDYLDFPLRLKFWRAHLNLILGNIEIGKRALIQIASVIPDGVWKTEMLAIRAMGYYFVGRTRDALGVHHECQASIKENPDQFLQTFDCSMAARAALKLCDPANFEYFSERLDLSLQRKDDSRYRLRHTGYRAMIFNQLGEHETAETHWKNGDEQLHSTESSLERGQYLIFRGMSYALVDDLAKAHRIFELARHELKLSGSPALYLAELDIAESLATIANPITRSSNLKRAQEVAEAAQNHFSEKAKVHVYPLQAMYSEAAEFCDGIRNGAKIHKPKDGRQSLVLSVIENVSSVSFFAKELSHFRLIPDFIRKLSESDLSDAGLVDSMESVFRIRPLLSEGQFRLPGAMESLGKKHEVKTILEFASTLCALGEKAKELYQTKSRLKEAVRAKHLLHDLRFFAQELSKQAQNATSSLNLSRLSEELNQLIESYLTAMNKGENPSQKTIVHFPKLLGQITETTTQITGKRPKIPKEQTLPFLWVSDVLLKRLLLNLVKNGVEAGHGPDPVMISYRIETVSQQERLAIYISDNGSGLDPNILETLSKTEDSIQSTKNSGIGLGLRSAIECAEEIGATLSIVPSTRSCGTCFKVIIPLPEQKNISIEPEILVIEDSRSVSDSWLTFAEQERIHIQCVYAEDAVSALNHLPESVDWIITDYDLKLPNCNGAILAPSLFALNRKVALSTGFQEAELPEDVRSLPWSTILGKEPQYPAVMKRNKIAIPTVEVKNGKVAQMLDEVQLRHEIKNELTPLRVALKGLLANHPDDRYVKLLATSVKGLERISKKKEVENAESTR